MKPPETSLLLSSSPRVFQPEIASVIGLNGAIFLQQLHFWLQRSDNVVDGERWVYHSYATWQTDGGLSFWSPKIIRTTIEKLEGRGLLISGRFNKLRYDKTKWYRIDYDKLYSLCPNGQTIGHTGPIVYPEWANGEAVSGKPIPKTTTEITAKNTGNNPTSPPEGDALTLFSDPRYEYVIQANDFPYIKKVLLDALRYPLAPNETSALNEIVSQHGKGDTLKYLRYLATPECREHGMNAEFLKMGITGLAERCNSDSHDDASNNRCPIEF